MTAAQTLSLAIKTLVSVLLFIVCIPNMESKHYHSIAGPFKIVVGKLEHCPGDDPAQGQMNFTYREYRSRCSPTLYSGNLSMPFLLNDGMSARMAMASWDRVAGWKPNAHKFHVDHVCRNMEFFFPTLYRSYMRRLFGEVPECYFLPGLYHIENLTIAWDDAPVKQFFYGRWRADLEMTYPNGKRAACIRGYGDTVPK